MASLSHELRAATHRPRRWLHSSDLPGARRLAPGLHCGGVGLAQLRAARPVLGFAGWHQAGLGWGNAGRNGPKPGKNPEKAMKKPGIWRISPASLVGWSNKHGGWSEKMAVEVYLSRRNWDFTDLIIIDQPVKRIQWDFCMGCTTNLIWDLDRSVVYELGRCGLNQHRKRISRRNMMEIYHPGLT